MRELFRSYVCHLALHHKSSNALRMYCEFFSHGYGLRLNVQCYLQYSQNTVHSGSNLYIRVRYKLIQQCMLYVSAVFDHFWTVKYMSYLQYVLYL